MAVMGRPKIYTPELLERAKRYLVDYQDGGEVCPTVAGLADALDIHRDTVYSWSKEDDKQDFSDIVAKVLICQEKLLVGKGLKGEFNSTIAKLLLAKHGYKDETDITTKGEKISSLSQVPTNELENIAAGGNAGTSETGTGEAKA